MEKLAVIAKVLELAPIEGADRIERATVLGWHVVVRKGLHKVGDLVVMVFPDSYAPKAYVDETYVGEDKTRIKTIKMRGQYSAGLVLPVSEVYAAAARKGLPSKVYDDGEEVSVLLDIEKWVAPIGLSTAGDEIGDFPTQYIPRTDELNFRSEPLALLEAQSDPGFKDTEFVATLKMDGTSATYVKHDGQYRVCGRNKEYAKTEGNLHWRMSDKYKIEENLPEGYAIQGEICGLGVQGNPMKFSDTQFLVFRVKNLKTHEYLGWDELKAFCSCYGFHHVPEVTRFIFTNSTTYTIETLQELANSAKYDHGRVNAEGVVILPVKPIRSMALQKPYWSLKVMNQPYDMKKG